MLFIFTIYIWHILRSIEITEIKKGIALSKDTFIMMTTILTNRDIRIYNKINTLKAYIWFILLHEFECWTLTKDLKRRLEAEKI